jgi:hypothetical protein
MVSFQKDIKRYHRLLGHMILVILILVGHIKKCACVRLNHLCVLRNSVLVVVSANLAQASSDTPLAVTAEAGPRLQHRVLPWPSILPRSCNVSMSRSHKGSRLSIFWRYSILTLHASGIDDDHWAQLTGWDKRVIQHQVTHHSHHYSLQTELRSGRPRVMSEDSDGCGYQDTSCRASKDPC